MGVLGLIPARGRSLRVERKNLRRLGGVTLVRRALETTVASGAFETVVLSSEDPEILAEAQGLDVVALRRPDHLAIDSARTFEVVRQALERLESDRGERYDAVGVVQCTSPFTAPEDLAGAVELLRSSGAPSVVSVVRLESAIHPLKLKRMEGDRLLPYLEDDEMKPSHELPELWVRNGSIYLTTRETIDRGVFIDDDVRGYVMPPERSHDIDTLEDLAFAEFLLSRDR
jgi:CMP-N-acetylneuraminic acid synthetase